MAQPPDRRLVSVAASDSYASRSALLCGIWTRSDLGSVPAMLAVGLPAGGAARQPLGVAGECDANLDVARGHMGDQRGSVCRGLSHAHRPSVDLEPIRTAWSV